MQLYIVSVILAAAAGYAAWRIYRIINRGESPCDDCQLKKNCQKFGRYPEK